MPLLSTGVRRIIGCVRHQGWWLHAEACNACGTLIVPCWKSAPFWPLICPDGDLFAPFVAAVYELPLSQGLFQCGRSGGVLFGGDTSNTPVLALRLCF